jgi:uncharacterized phage protein gp47/JayE
LAFNRPTLAALIARGRADVEGRLRGTDALLRWTPERILSTSTAGYANELHGRIDWLSKQIVPNPDMDDAFADRWAAVWFAEPDDLLLGIPAGRKPASPAVGAVAVAGTNGSVLDQYWEVIRKKDGYRYRTDNLYTYVADGTVNIPITAILAAGTLDGSPGNTPAGTAMLLSNPVAGITTECVVAEGGLTGGQPRETTPQLVSRLLRRIQTPQRSGAQGDYANWALRVPGVTRAWEVARAAGPGTVYVFVVSDSVPFVVANDILVASVQAYLDVKRPSTADVTVFAAGAHGVSVTIHLRDDTTAARAAVVAELQNLFLTIGSGQTVALADLNFAIAAAVGSGYVLSAPTADVTVPSGQQATFAGVTWT